MRHSAPAAVFLGSLAAVACSAGTPPNVVCATVKSDAQVAKSDSVTMDYLTNQKSAPGGELIIEFRNQGILAPPSHQKKCSFYLEPSPTHDSATIWTASHCLDLATDSRYRLRFYIDSATGYGEVPVEFSKVKSAEKFRQLIAKKSLQTQQAFIEALTPTPVDHTASKNGTDICLNSFASGYGWSKFHQPVPGQNQIACFLYHDLALVSFSLAESADTKQKKLLEDMIIKARKFDAANIAHPEATLVRDGVEKKMIDFRTDWLKTYKTYTELRAQTGFAKFAQKLALDCLEPSKSTTPVLCQEAESIEQDLRQSGFPELAELLSEQGLNAFDSAYKNIVPEISKHWKFYANATVSVNGQVVRPYSQFNILTNFSWNSGALQSYSSIPLMGFVGLDWGTVTDPHSGDVRARAGAATYHWLNDGSEMFIYAIIPKKQTQENLTKGFGQLSLKPGDSGTLILADGLPMAVLATVDGEKTSGGSSVLPLPDISDDIEAISVSNVNSTGASAEAQAIVAQKTAGTTGCIR